jgi:acetoacetate decarboxylase
MTTIKSMPLDAPLYQMDAERGIEYWGCRGVMATFTTTPRVAPLVPDGLHLGDPAIAALLVADYGASTLGPYREYVALLQVTDDDGVAGMYIPYIYVTNDAAMAAGRELLGAPKKLADIAVDVEPEAVVGRLSRPSSCPLVEVVVAPAERVGGDVLDALLPPGTPLYSLRSLPGPPGSTQVHELIRWSSALAVRSDAFGDGLRFTGPTSVRYPSQTAVDPVHQLEVETMLGGAYLEFDMRLTAGSVVWSRTEVAAAAHAAQHEPEPVGA